jgi:hypothetical protein
MLTKILCLCIIIAVVAGQGGCYYGGYLYACGAKVPSGQYCNWLGQSPNYNCGWWLCSNYIGCDCYDTPTYCKNPSPVNFTK